MTTMTAEPANLAGQLILDYRMPAETLRNLLCAVRFARLTDSSRYQLGGCLLRIENYAISAIATDGRRLVVRQFESPTSADRPHDIVIPQKQFDQLCDIGKTAGRVIIQSNGQTTSFGWQQRNGSRVVHVDNGERFPDVDQVLDAARDRDPSYSIGITASAPDSPDVDAVVLSAKGKLTRKTSRLEVTEELGKCPDIKFNLEYLSEWLDSLADPKAPVMLEFGDKHDPIYCHVNRPKQSVLAEYVLMPLNRD